MSDLRIALIAEGVTDQIVIESALKSFLTRPFIMTLLQPEAVGDLGGLSPTGGGWGGVYRWCRQMVSMGYDFSCNPSLAGFDLIVIHVDADVAGMQYSDARIDDNPNHDLPCEQPCPPAEDSVTGLRSAVAGWLDLGSAASAPANCVFCTPSKCTEAWVVTALYHQRQPALLVDIECNPGLEAWLSQRPLSEGARLVKGRKKQTRRYREAASAVTDQWSEIEGHCAHALRFRRELLSVI